jgi:GAF domain-containing protein
VSVRTSTQAFADAAAAMTEDGHVGDILARLLADCAEVLGADAVAILVTDRRERLTLLSSTSSVAADLEMLQAQDEQGPCVDAVRTGEVVVARSPADLARRWGHVGEAIADAGFAAVTAHPMRWRGRVLGGLNVFRTSPDVHEEDRALVRAFADVATIVLVHSSDLPTEQVTSRVHEAVVARSVIEQAKGVLSELEDLDMEGAAHRLGQLSRSEGLSLTETARRVLGRAQHQAR